MFSIYVRNLPTSVACAALALFFQNIERVHSIKIGVDKTTGLSLGYGYVNYFTFADADCAIHHISNRSVNGRACHAMWDFHLFPLLQDGPVNVLVKNLDPCIDSRSLFMMFLHHGKILSAYAAQESAKSKIYGFVLFGRRQEAEATIQRLNVDHLQQPSAYPQRLC